MQLPIIYSRDNFMLMKDFIRMRPGKMAFVGIVANDNKQWRGAY
jgi:hypothetical protein